MKKRYESGGSVNPQDLTDSIAKQENKEDVAAMDKYVVNPIKEVGTRLKNAVMGSPEANAKAAAEMAAQDKANPNSFQAKTNRVLSKKKGGTVRSSASKRGDGIASKGHTKGRMV